MTTDVVTQVPFDPAIDLLGRLRSGTRVLRRQDGDSSDPPSCNDNNSVPVAALQVPGAATSNMALAGYYIADRRPRSGARQAAAAPSNGAAINGSNTADAWVECRSDAGVHGDGVNATRLWAADGNDGPWTDDAAQASPGPNPANNGYVFYSANYINWLNDGSTITQIAARDRAAGRDQHDQPARRGRQPSTSA